MVFARALRQRKSHSFLIYRRWADLRRSKFPDLAERSAIRPFPIFGETTFLEALSKSFGSSEASISCAISTKRLCRSSSVSFGSFFFLCAVGKSQRRSSPWLSGRTRQLHPGVNLINEGCNIYKEGALKPTPSPILVRRFTGIGGWHDTCAGIMGLTKMDWNNNTLYKKLPVTLVYSKAFADIIQQNPNIVDSVFDFRNFM
jgi:hypothetical protein